MPLQEIPFGAYFEYVTRLGGKTRSEIADRWLIETYFDVGPKPTFWDVGKAMGQVNAKNQGRTFEMPVTYDGFEFCQKMDVPDTFYWHFQESVQSDAGKAIRLAVHTCYLGKAEGEAEFKPISEISNKLTFHHAEMLVKHFTSFFAQ